MKNLVFFASGSGTNFQSVIDAVESETINANIAGLITNKTNIKAIERAENYDIPVHTLAPNQFASSAKYENKLLSTLDQWDPYLVVLAGYLLKIPASMIQEYANRIINIHPSLLPAYGGKGYYGLKVHQAVLENNETETGCSIHIVTEEYDQGPVLDQRKVTVNPSDTPEQLAARVLKQEHRLLTEVIKNLVEDPHFYLS